MFRIGCFWTTQAPQALGWTLRRLPYKPRTIGVQRRPRSRHGPLPRLYGATTSRTHCELGPFALGHGHGHGVVVDLSRRDPHIPTGRRRGCRRGWVPPGQRAERTVACGSVLSAYQASWPPNPMHSDRSAVRWWRGCGVADRGVERDRVVSLGRALGFEPMPEPVVVVRTRYCEFPVTIGRRASVRTLPCLASRIGCLP
jgi:hypothetical protein